MATRTGAVTDDAGPEGQRVRLSNVKEIAAPVSPKRSVRRTARAALRRDILNSEPWRVRFLVIYDALVAALSVQAGHALSPAYQWIYESASPLLDAATLVPLFAVTFLLAAFVSGMYESDCLKSPGSALIPVVGAVAATWGILILVYYAVTFSVVGRWIVVISAFGLCGAAVLPRISSVCS